MRLIHTGYHLELVLQENQITVLSVENPKAYTDLLHDIWNQAQGEEGEFILSEQGKIKNISKEVDCIFNPFLLDCNDKKVMNKLYQELKELTDSTLANESIELHSSIMKYMDRLFIQVPYALAYHIDFDIVGLLKLYGVKIDCSGESLLDKIVEYLRAMRQICHVAIYVFIGLKQYLTEDELRKLYEFVFYEKIYLVIFEAGHSQVINGEKCWLFDKDMCIIEL